MDTKECRTRSQFEEIIETHHNGNLSRSYELAEEYGFHASDLREFYVQEDWWFDSTALVSIAEGAERIRGQKERHDAVKDALEKMYKNLFNEELKL